MQARILTGMVVVLSSGFELRAEDNFWVGYQNNCMQNHPDVGSFFHGDNWLNFVVPGANDSAIFGSGVDPQGNGVRPHTLHFGDFCLDVPNCPNPIPVPGGNATNARLVMQSDSWVFDFDSGSIGNCQPPGNVAGSYVVGDSVVGDIIGSTGQPGTASLEVRGQGTFTTSAFFLGMAPGSSGSAVITGADTLFVGQVNAGWLGHGRLTIQNGAAVQSGAVQSPGLALLDGSSGEVRVTGAGSHWTIDAQLLLGLRGRGTVEVLDGGLGRGNETLVGGFASGDGALIVSGNGSHWDERAGLQIGVDGNGRLDVSSKGTVSSRFGTVASATGSRGLAVIRGRGAAWTIAEGALTIGRLGHGTMEVSDGGTVRSPLGFIGFGDANAAGEGSVIVKGSRSAWRMENALVIGGGGTGRLEVLSGGTLTSRSAWLGTRHASATGTAAVRGRGSTWVNELNVVVGEVGAGALSVEDQGRLSAASVEVNARGALSGNATVEADVTNGGEVRPGASVGELTVEGAYRQTPEGVLLAEIGGHDHDRLIVDGAADLNGELQIEFAEGFTPQLGDVFELVACQSRSGEFARIEADEIGEGLYFKAAYDARSVTLAVGSDVTCDEIQRFKAKCRNGTLKGSIKSWLPPDTPLVIDNAGDQSIVALDGRGSGKFKYRDQTGERRVALVECREFERLVNCNP